MSRRSACIAVLALVLVMAPSTAHADFGLAPDGFHVAALDAVGQPEARAGAHPDRLVTSFAFNTLDGGGADGNVKDVMIDLPPGFVGDANAAPTCPRTDSERGRCQPESQVGSMKATFAGFNTLTLPIYNVAPQAGEIAEFGVFVLIFPVRFYIGLRADSDYGTRIELRDLAQNLPLTSGEVELWGVPADHQSGTTIPRRALLTNPTSCGPAPPTTTLHVRSWQQPDHWIDANSPNTGPLTGCDTLAFSPTLALGLDTPAADTPSGMSVGLTLPQDDDPIGRATSHVRDVAVTLPAGLTLSPGVADGLGSCDDAQLGIGTTNTPSCPASSKIGTVELTTPLIPDALKGDIFLGRPLLSDRYRMFVTASGRGVTLKLTGSLRPDPETGQMFVSLTGLPALPFSHLRLHFKDGPRAPLATPPRCGAGAGTASVIPYSSDTPTQLPAQIEIVRAPGGAPCPVKAPFAPQLIAGSSPPISGADSSFAMTLRRADGEQTLKRLDIDLPPGLTARLTKVPSCPDAAVAAAACPVASRIGSVAVEAGAGPSPLPLSGDAYLTGRYHGAPFGLALVVRAHAGPLDLGTTVIRATTQLDPTDAHLTIATDPLPRVVAGVPLRLRTLALDIDRHRFMLNPTACSATRIRASVASLDEARMHTSARYAIRGCERLKFAPRVSMALEPSAELRRGGHPELRIALRPRPGQTALLSARVELPRLVALDPSAVTTICTRERAQEGRCPRGSSVGTARARTPLLPRPLRGSINVVQPDSGTQPELWAMLAGNGVRLHLRSTTSTSRSGAIVSTFVGIPDIPVSSFTLRLRGGRSGLLSMTSGLCENGKARAILTHSLLRGQNGKHRSRLVRVNAHPACAR